MAHYKYKKLTSNRLSIHKKQIVVGKPPQCPICLEYIHKGDVRLETWLYGDRSRHLHLDCAEKLSYHILHLIYRETGGEHGQKKAEWVRGSEKSRQDPE